MFSIYNCFQLDHLGSLCALMPDLTQTETELQIVNTLISGIGKTQDDGGLNYVILPIV